MSGPPLLPPLCLSHLSDCPYSCCGPVSTAPPPNDPGHLPTAQHGTTTTKMFEKSTRSPNDVLQHRKIDLLFLMIPKIHIR